jgi:hypothetical protein
VSGEVVDEREMAMSRGRGHGQGRAIDSTTHKVLREPQKFEFLFYLVNPVAGFVISCETPRITISRSPPGKESPVAWLPKSTVRDCGQRRVAMVETAVRALLLLFDSAYIAFGSCFERYEEKKRSGGRREKGEKTSEYARER